MRNALLIACCSIAGPGIALAQGGRTMTIDDLISTVRVADPALSPDGRQVVYTLTTTEPGSLKRVPHLWLVPADGGGPPRQLTRGEKGESDAIFSPDGRQVAFLADRTGTPQVHLLRLDGGEALPLTSVAMGAQGPLVWSPDGKRIAFVTDAFPPCTADACNRQRRDEKARGPQVHHARRLLYRHWNQWREDVRHHVFVADATSGAVTDVTPGDFDAPPVTAEERGMAFSPDGRELCFVSNRDGPDREAWSTNNDLWTVAVTGGAAARRTTGKGADVEPHYTPDGRSIVFRSQARAGFEADRWRIVALDRASGATRVLFDAPDLSAHELALTADGKTVVFTAEQGARMNLYAVPLAGGAPRLVHGGGAHGDVAPTPDGRAAVMVISAFTAPPDLFRVSLDNGAIRRLTDHNRAWLARVVMPTPQTLTVKGAGGAEVMAWVLPPPRLDPQRKYPVVFMIHGGPQQAWFDGWSYRWNPALWASQGWVVVAPNPRGSTGFGQRFVDEISRDWGGKAIEDLTAVFDAAVKKPFVDPSRQAAAGASYGGYAVNWLIGHTDRFRAAVSHDGVWNVESMSAATEELWFPEWEFGGPSYSPEARELMRRWSPHLFADRIKTPTLVITNDLDFRVPVDQGIQLFTALRRRGIPSELLDFPGEGHWVLNPKNSRYWHQQVFGWLRRWLDRPASKPGAGGARASLRAGGALHRD
jgi:dipeptidyl aminopeptidase/acylaminoacyl peptidase